MELTLTCTSELSTSPFGAFDSNSFTLKLEDVCRTATLSIADLSPTVMSTSLWPVPAEYFDFTGLQSSLPCGPYKYYIESDAPIASGLSVYNLSNRLAIQAEMNDLS